MPFELKQNHRILLEINPHEGSQTRLQWSALDLTSISKEYFEEAKKHVEDIAYIAENPRISDINADATCTLEIYDNATPRNRVAIFEKSSTNILSTAEKLSGVCMRADRKKPEPPPAPQNVPE